MVVPFVKNRSIGRTHVGLNDHGSRSSQMLKFFRPYLRNVADTDGFFLNGRVSFDSKTRSSLMGRQEKAAAGSLCLGSIFLLLQFVMLTECKEFEVFRGNGTKCLLDREACTKAEGSQCEWCELPQQCYRKEVAKKLGASCNGSQRRQLKEVQDCADIAGKERCLSFDHCRWCRSDVLDDGCLRAWEARKLPRQVFECSKVT